MLTYMYTAVIKTRALTMFEIMYCLFSFDCLYNYVVSKHMEALCTVS